MKLLSGQGSSCCSWVSLEVATWKRNLVLRDASLLFPPAMEGCQFLICIYECSVKHVCSEFISLLPKRNVGKEKILAREQLV